MAGTEFGIFAAIISVLAMISMALAGILASSRFLFAMGQDKLLPPALERVHEKYETPHWPIIVTGVAMGLAIFFVPLKDVVKLASGFKIMIFIMINTCVIILRQTSDRHDWNPSYKGALYPFMQLWGILAGLFLITSLEIRHSLEHLLHVAGLLTYYLYGWKHAKIKKTPFHSFIGRDFKGRDD